MSCMNECINFVLLGMYLGLTVRECIRMYIECNYFLNVCTVYIGIVYLIKCTFKYRNSVNECIIFILLYMYIDLSVNEFGRRYIVGNYVLYFCLLYSVYIIIYLIYLFISYSLFN